MAIALTMAACGVEHRQRTTENHMKNLRLLLTLGATAVSLFNPRVVIAQATTPPTVVPQDRDDRDLLRDLRGVPDPIKSLILDFDQTRDQYLRQQRLLLIRLRHATTPEERQAIREQLQDNRQQFLNELKSFREQLRDDLKNLAGKISHREFGRIIDAAKDAATDGPHHHRGH
jgi:hypothetical protein